VARLLREQGQGLDVAAPYIVVSIDDAGLDFLIIRGGQLYFEYANIWRDLADDKGTISPEKFQEALERSLRQVMNFYLQHWEGAVAGVVVAAAVFVDEVQRAAEEALSLPVVSLATMMGNKISPEWFVAFGTGLRSLYSRAKDHEITLLGEGARETYEKDRVLGFAVFWRIAVPVILGAFLVLFGVADFFIGRVAADVASSSALHNAGGAAAVSENQQEIAALEAQAAAFNQSVALVASLEHAAPPKSGILDAFAAAATVNGVTITRISFPAPGSPLFLSGSAPSQAQVLSYKAALEASARFLSVNLPLANIQSNGGTYTFSMTIALKDD
jgi:Tfp pilus assembly protein PilN